MLTADSYLRIVATGSARSPSSTSGGFHVLSRRALSPHFPRLEAQLRESVRYFVDRCRERVATRMRLLCASVQLGDDFHCPRVVVLAGIALACHAPYPARRRRPGKSVYEAGFETLQHLQVLRFRVMRQPRDLRIFKLAHVLRDGVRLTQLSFPRSRLPHVVQTRWAAWFGRAQLAAGEAVRGLAPGAGSAR